MRKKCVFRFFDSMGTEGAGMNIFKQNSEVARVLSQYRGMLRLIIPSHSNREHVIELLVLQDNHISPARTCSRWKNLK